MAMTTTNDDLNAKGQAPMIETPQPASTNETAPRHSAGPWRWFNYPDGRKLLCGTHKAVIHCPDAPVSIDPLDAALIAAAPELLSALAVIQMAVRGDEKSECWTIRKWLNDRDIFNDDLQSSDRLIEAVCLWVINKAEGR